MKSDGLAWSDRNGTGRSSTESPRSTAAEETRLDTDRLASSGFVWSLAHTHRHSHHQPVSHFVAPSIHAILTGKFNSIIK
jgi:hypothetical protein